MRTSPWQLGLSIVVTTVLAAMLPTAARAQLTGAEASCRATIANAMGKYVKTLQKSVTSCHKKRNAGLLLTSVDCNDPVVADTNGSGKITKAGNSAEAKIAASCGAVLSVLADFARCPAPHQASDDSGATVGIDDFTELTACLIAHADTVVSRTMGETLGLPDSSLSSDESRCHGAIAKSLARIIDTTIKEKSRCQKQLDASGGPGGYECSSSDPNGKILAASGNGTAAIEDACSQESVTAGVDSCAGDPDELVDCVVNRHAPDAGAGIAGMIHKFNGICPGSISVQMGRYGEFRDEVDSGALALIADHTPIDGYTIAKFEISCDADCANCVAATVAPPDDYCRCTGDESFGCETNGDCLIAGGTCTCFITPPAPYNASGYPLCVMHSLSSPMSGDVQPATGDVSLTIPTTMQVYTGTGITQPCPTCEAGFCNGGDRDGLSCSIDGLHSTFGPVSLDCPPNEGANISGTGARLSLQLGTGAFSLPANIPCDAPNGAEMCACSTCSLDNAIPCNSNAECIAASAGVCRTDGMHGGWQRERNACNDNLCSADVAPNEGTCLANAPDTFCDGLLSETGRGLVVCNDNSDCATQLGVCSPSMFEDCGLCTVEEAVDCFRYPIAANGTPFEQLAGGACVSPVANALTNNAFGLPGPIRYQQGFVLKDGFCEDGITPYIFPGGVDCVP